MNGKQDFARALSNYLAQHTDQSSGYLQFLIESFMRGGTGQHKLEGAAKDDIQRVLKADLAAQNNVPSFLQDYLLRRLLRDDWTAQGAFMAWRYVQRAAQERFIAWPRRQEMIAELGTEPVRGTEWGFRQLLYSQGAGRPFHWRGVPCFKSVYDLAIYAMLVQELRPGTIVELGSGAGGSALFLADLCTSANLATRIVSIDTAAVDRNICDPRIAFVRADCAEWLKTTAGSKREFPGPCLMIEDFHGDLTGVFADMDASLDSGDYLVIEDSNPKQSRIAEVIAGHSYLIDSRYTDFFGINCTSAINSIFIKHANAGLMPP